MNKYKKLLSRKYQLISIVMFCIGLLTLYFNYGSKCDEVQTITKGFFTKSTSRQGGLFIKMGDDLNSFAIPEYINSVSDLVGLLKEYNRSGNQKKVTGSSLIVNTMMGHSSPALGKWINDASWKNLEFILDQTKIIWDSNVIGCLNRYYQSIGDASIYSNCSSEPGISFIGPDGSVVYQLIRRTGSPVGDYMALPLSYNSNIIVDTEEVVGDTEIKVVMGSDKCRMAGIGINKAMISKFGYSIDNLNYDGLYSNTSNINTDIYTLRPAIKVDSVNGICYYF